MLLWLPKHFMFVQTQCWGKITVLSHRVQSREPSWSLKCINSSWFVWSMGKMMEGLKALKCWNGGNILQGFWLSLFYTSSILLHTFLTFLPSSKVHGSAIHFHRAVGTVFLCYICATVSVPNFKVWAHNNQLRNAYACQITYPLLEHQLCERRWDALPDFPAVYLLIGVFPSRNLAPFLQVFAPWLSAI